MNAGQRSARQLASRSDSVCISCRETISRRRYASAAAAVKPVAASETSIPPIAQASTPRQVYQIHSGVVVSRPPVITRDLHPFEKAFFLYQRRLNERLALSFTRHFYYKDDTPAGEEWKRRIKERKTAARDIGAYNAWDKETGWHDELLIGAQESEPDHQVEALIRDAETPNTVGGSNAEASKKFEPLERPMPRVSEADKTGDQKSLNRLLQRSIYLLVKNAAGKWVLPHDRLVGREHLDTAAQRVLEQIGGRRMNTWIVGKAPVGHHSLTFPEPTLTESGAEELGEKIFFMKVRIMAGQADLSENKTGFNDFKWLAKEEVQKIVAPEYWHSINKMLADL
ncbi:hypothetical protein K490DRAFT_74419 [Saccharata proteae CBS 121410]|uniref:Large ribosomal subunit protein mL46 n=1 Tax=Saccharata proteae CBS 121410 TaxID=1314787 RepID=A0A9P4LWH0_9PEZI|nr:hypothetical protein K490DRAFT_74419 [Saccharata proteae CBS 121410]